MLATIYVNPPRVSQQKSSTKHTTPEEVSAAEANNVHAHAIAQRCCANLRAAQAEVDEKRLEPDNKAMAVYLKPSFQLLGSVDRKANGFVWEEAGAAAVGKTVSELQSKVQ